MPRPMDGLVPIAELGSKFEADAVVARLVRAGIDAVPSYDPGLNTVAPFVASERYTEVLVRTEDVDRALEELALPDDGLPPEFHDEWTPTTTTRTRSRARIVVFALAFGLWGVPLLIVLISQLA